MMVELNSRVSMARRDGAGQETYRRTYRDRLIVNFLETVNTALLYAEIFDWLPKERMWKLRDAGNGEQAAWLSWAMLVIRREAGLSNKEMLRPPHSWQKPSAAHKTSTSSYSGKLFSKGGLILDKNALHNTHFACCATNSD